MKSIAFVTSSEDADLTNDDRLALPVLREQGIEITPVVWDSEFNPDKFEALVFRSCWDYHRKWQKFISLLESLKRHPYVFNSPDVMLWNVNKKHLLDLADKGVKIPRTKWFTRGKTVDISQLGFSNNVVVKPAISMGGDDTYLLPSNDIFRLNKMTNELLRDRDVLLQEFIPEIQTAGETSFIFFNGKFSHALCKKPKQGEFRIHVEYGGTHTLVEPISAQISAAEFVLMAANKDYLYARVDGVFRGNEFVLIELELIDPSLFFPLFPKACETFAKALAGRMVALSSTIK